MEPGHLIILRRGAIHWNSLSDNRKTDDQLNTFKNTFIMNDGTLKESEVFVSQQAEQSLTSKQMVLEEPPITESFSNIINIKSLTHTKDGIQLNYKLYDIAHISEYNYSVAVEHSSHTFRLKPVEDEIQEVVNANLELSVDGELLQFEDVFSNHSIHYDITNSYSRLLIKSTSRVKVYCPPPDDHSPLLRHSTIPLVWMPWQRQMMLPYLLPPELPETQLRQLNDFAMSFLERNDYHLMDSLIDINTKIYEDFSYVQGITSLETTPFDVFSHRQGVCQDFANLFICLCRLLNIPARYRVGYIYTGGNYENKLQSDASHAWAEVYLPYIGWRGFDPTNGNMVTQDHIRVACGRNYLDATPVSGTIYKGGDNEQLKVEVQIRDISS
jgi:transglutaminase-like putative cysteine protease